MQGGGPLSRSAGCHQKMTHFCKTSENTKLAGLMVEELGPQMARRFQLDADINGVVVTAIQPESIADSAGLQQGDVISEINKQPGRNLDDYKSAISNLSDERPALLLILRQSILIFMALKT